MIIIVGLGNPGAKYNKTRHNIGFRAVDEIAANFRLSERGEAERRMEMNEVHRFPAFSFQSRLNVQISKGEILNKKVALVKPQTFMNLSGISVKKLFKNLKLKIENLIVIHDDISLPLGKIRISVGRGAGGHKGVESIIKELKTKNFARFRIGIGYKTNNMKHRAVENFVLKKFNKEEEKTVKTVIKKTAEAIEMTIKEGTEKAMNTYNR